MTYSDEIKIINMLSDSQMSLNKLKYMYIYICNYTRTTTLHFI